MPRFHYLLSALLLALGGCATTVVPPLDPPAPRPVFVLDHGRHTSLVLTRDGGELVRYAYGEWRWYALDDTGPLRAIGAVFWPTRGTLGRRELPGPAGAGTVRRRLRVGIENLHRLEVAGAKADALLAELDGAFDAAQREAHPQPLYDLVFVPHPDDYHLFRNSNHAVAAWLEMLGCEVRGPRMLADWRVAEGRNKE